MSSRNQAFSSQSFILCVHPVPNVSCLSSVGTCHHIYLLFVRKQAEAKQDMSFFTYCTYLFESALSVTIGSLVAQMVKNLPAMWETVFDPWVGKIHWRREWQPTLVFLPGESHEQRSLTGYSPWGHKESDMTEQVTLICGNRENTTFVPC